MRRSQAQKSKKRILIHFRPRLSKLMSRAGLSHELLRFWTTHAKKLHVKGWTAWIPTSTLRHVFYSRERQTNGCVFRHHHAYSRPKSLFANGAFVAGAACLLRRDHFHGRPNMRHITVAEGTNLVFLRGK